MAFSWIGGIRASSTNGYRRMSGLPLPAGAVCPGGADVLAESNWWRASNISSALCLLGAARSRAAAAQGWGRGSFWGLALRTYLG